MSDTPLVTVYIPTYNRRVLLERAVESVLTQTYTNLEVVIVDDCSTDDTLDYLAEVAEKDKRVRYFQNEKNSGACVSRNKAIMEAKGEFITGLDDDDYFLPERIEQFIAQWPILEAKHSDMVCLFSNVLVKRDAAENAKLKQYKKPKKVKQKDLLISNFIGNQVFTKAENLRKVMFDENLPMWQDLDCWYRLLGHVNIACNTGLALYVLDTSHEHERITNKNIRKVIRTFIFVSKKYRLDRRSYYLLKYQLTTYKCPYFSIRNYFLWSFKADSFKVLYFLLKRFLSCKQK